MAFNEIETARYKKEVVAYIEYRRPPVDIRKQVDLGFRIAGQSVEIFEVRPHLKDSTKIIEHAVAKATYVKTQKNWKIYWQRSDLKWHEYEPDTLVGSIIEFLEIVEKDEHACFWG